MNPTWDPTTRPIVGPTVAAGWIYVHHTRRDPTKYVGQTIRPPWVRIREERRTFTWGAELLPGRDGYSIVCRVESEGDPTIDAVLLDLAEAEAIRRLDPTENRNRPDPEIFRARLAAARAGLLPTPRPRPRRAGRVRPFRHPTGGGRTRRGVPWRTVGRALLAVAWAIVGLMMTVHSGNPTTPWVVVPIAAVLGPPLTIHFLSGKPRRRRGRSRRRR